METGVLFWLIIIVGIIFGFLDTRVDPNNHRWGYATWLVIGALIGLLGYRVFGFPFHN